MGQFSRVYLRNNFLKLALSLSTDKSVGVKGSLAEMLSDIRQWINQDDGQMINSFNRTLEKLRKDKSKYV